MLDGAKNFNWNGTRIFRHYCNNNLFALRMSTEGNENMLWKILCFAMLIIYFRWKSVQGSFSNSIIKWRTSLWTWKTLQMFRRFCHNFGTTFDIWYSTRSERNEAIETKHSFVIINYLNLIYNFKWLSYFRYKSLSPQFISEFDSIEDEWHPESQYSNLLNTLPRPWMQPCAKFPRCKT